MFPQTPPPDPPIPPDPPPNKPSINAKVDEYGKKLDISLNAQKVSLVVTTRPFIPTNSSQASRKMNFRNNKKTAENIEILPGLFESNSYEKYLTFGIENTDINDVDILDLHREIVKCIGREPKITNQRNGTLLIETSSAEESAKLKALDCFKGIKASCTPHSTLNQCKGVIYSHDLLRYSEENS